MTGRTLTALVAGVLGVAFFCLGGIMAVAGTASTCSVIVSPSGETTARYDAEQLHHVQIIVAVGVQRSIPVRGQIIAVATAIQESNLRNQPNLGDRNDHDSLGLFQQRPSQGWGTPEQIMNPAYAAGRFYDKLINVAGWQSMPLTEAAQAVQVSAYPDAYAKWESDATVLVGLTAGPSGSAAPVTGEQCISVAGWMKPVAGPVVSAPGTAPPTTASTSPRRNRPRSTPPPPVSCCASSATPTSWAAYRTHAMWTATRSPYAAAVGTPSCCTPTRPSPGTATWCAGRSSTSDSRWP
jgi:hypothetical protein